MSRRNHIQKLINGYTRRLQKLQETQSYTGIETPPQVLIEIEDIEARLGSLKAELALLPADQPDQPVIPPAPPAAPSPTAPNSISISNTTIQGDVVTGGKEVVNTGGAPYIKDTTIDTGGGDVEVVGKKNVFIISVPLALLALALLVVIVNFNDAVQRQRDAGGVLASLWPLPTPTFTPPMPTPTSTPVTPMPNNFFNIGVAQFTEATAAGNLEITEVSRQFSDFLFTVIEETSKQPEMAAQVRGPQLIGVVPGQDFTVRAREAERIAKAHNANFIIFGLIRFIGRDNNGRDTYQAELEFYLSPQTHPGFEYGSEITGAQQLAQFEFSWPFDSPTLKAQLGDRIKILQHVVTGLSYFYFGKYEDAWAKFYQASVANTTDDFGNLPILHLLMGSAKLQSYGPKLPAAEKTKLLDEAEKEFWEANEPDRGYARSYLGLGIVSFQQATSQTTTSITSTDPVKLAEAVEWYTRAQNTGEQTAQIQEKADFGLAQAYKAGVMAGLPDYSLEQMYHYFNQVLDAYQKDPEDPILTSQAAHVHAYQGWLAGNREVKDWAVVSSEFRKAIDAFDELPTPPTDWLAWCWHYVAIAEEKQGNNIKARDAYKMAVNLGENSHNPGAFSPEDLEKWRDKLAELEGETPQ